MFQASQRLARTLSYDTVFCFRLFIIPFIYELYSKLCVYRRAAKTVSPNRMCKQICQMHFPLFLYPRFVAFTVLTFAVESGFNYHAD